MTNKLLQFPLSRSSLADSTHSSAPPRADLQQIVTQLAAGACPADSEFDRFLPEPLRRPSSQHWTPLAVAVRAAEWFDNYSIRTVVDIGSGAGKFCVGAALAGHCHFTGLEHREHLVAGARSLARTFEVESRVHFIHGSLGSAKLPAADAYYLYNPFEENLLNGDNRIDDEVELSPERHARDLAALRELLVAARTGTYVLVYNGLGARLPANYRGVCTDRELPNVLRLWRKAAPRAVSYTTHSARDGASA